MASERWFRGQIEALEKTLNAKATVKSDGKLDHSASLAFKGEEPSLRTIEQAADRLNLRVSDTEKGFAVQPR